MNVNRGSRYAPHPRHALSVALLASGCLASIGTQAQVVQGGNPGNGGNLGNPAAAGNVGNYDSFGNAAFGAGREGFQPRLEASEVFVDNVDLAGPGASKDSAFITQVRPGFRYEETRPRFQGLADYTFQYLFYSNNNASNQGYHQLSAYANGEVIPDLFFVRADAGASQVVVDAARPSTLDTLLNTNGNLVNGYTGSVSPYLQRHVGDTLALLEYTRGFVSYRGTDNGGFGGSTITGSRNQRLRANWGTDDATLTRFSWNASFDRQEADYGNEAPTFRYEEALLKLEYGLTPQLRLIAEGGAESNLSNGNNEGHLDTGFYQGGFSYSLGRSNQIRILMGHRFYGTSYEFLYRYTGRVLELESTYTEGPTTEAQELFIRPINGAAGAAPVVQPVVTGGDLARLTGEVFVRKYLNSRLVLRGRRTAIELDLNVYRRNYLVDTAKDDHSVEATGGIIRDLSSRDRLRLSYGFRRYFLIGGEDLRESAYKLEWVRQLSRTLAATGTVGRLEGSGTSQRYTVNYAMVGVSKAF